MKKSIQGMSLVELLVTLLIGIIVAAAALQVLLISTLNYNIQKSMSELQDNGNFGLNYIIRDIKLANLDANQSVINDRNNYGGIVLTSRSSYTGLTEEELAAQPMNFPSHLKSNSGLNLVSRTGIHTSAAGTSDQLVIQYRAYEPDTFDCEGNKIEQEEINRGTFIVQRYFLRKDGEGYALACDAGRYQALLATPAPSITNFGDNGQIIIRRVDHFKFLLGIKENDKDEYRYLSVEDYMGEGNKLTKNADPRPRIMSIQLAILSRSYEAVNNNETIRTKFNIFNKEVEIKDADKKYLREVITQTIALRNGYGLMEEL
ncbi:hypothetical protein F939_00886 [Acinetobacter radioresistens DSM 6976 = NBRC 102413 = CIP 103788]|uniref:PilW family protein n=1 Tax=Acinetobacter radioresistens TaxID=40216 RepID=UPI000277C69D|nr:PilW family protein [Acinetobacter radioresistens]EJO34363.1 hypothetical protein ACINWCA157_2829 [Acinetobacter radioresistens WC-A-157]ENV90194.1 hypothetical protein F939_00886 [Acinetobacter radioresistens DSM 6976 = NBRC 102413 = CIP 103788]MCU4516417.1 PilW family protein [Acinetobacter radioresistens]BBL21858.1 pilus assembly protein PilW [Acinetobacter radioresistens DSM 6976 = NBRC 102413 = CIP 103788]